MRKTTVGLIVLLLVSLCLGQAATQPVTIAGCILNANGTFRLMTRSKTYVLKGHRNELFGFNGKMVEVTGTVEEVSKAEGVPAVMHVTHVKKLADFCQ